MGEQGIWTVCTNSAVRRAARQLGQFYDDCLAPSGLRATQHSLLTQIAYLRNPTPRSLADALVMDLSALLHTLKPLVRDGLVELLPDEKDRRAKRVQLTETGRAKQREGLELWRGAQARFDALFGAEESAALRRALGRISSDGFARELAVPTEKPKG